MAGFSNEPAEVFLSYTSLESVYLVISTNEVMQCLSWLSKIDLEEDKVNNAVVQ